MPDSTSQMAMAMAVETDSHSKERGAMDGHHAICGEGPARSRARLHGKIDKRTGVGGLGKPSTPERTPARVALVLFFVIHSQRSTTLTWQTT